MDDDISRKPVVPLSDEALEANLNGDGWARALTELWQRHLGLLWNVAREATRNDADAEDVLSEVFTRLAERAASEDLVITSSFRAYAVRAVRNRAIKAGQRRDREVLSNLEQMEEDTPAEFVAPGDFTLRGDDELVAAAFRSLPERSREVLWLSEVEVMPPREVADVLDTTPNNAAQLASRSRSLLREGFIRLHLRMHDVDPMCERFVTDLPAHKASRLSAARTRALEDHLTQCGECRSVANRLDNDITPLRALTFPIPAAVSSLAVAWLRGQGAVNAAPDIAFTSASIDPGTTTSVSSNAAPVTSGGTPAGAVTTGGASSAGLGAAGTATVITGKTLLIGLTALVVVVASVLLWIAVRPNNETAAPADAAVDSGASNPADAMSGPVGEFALTPATDELTYWTHPLEPNLWPANGATPATVVCSVDTCTVEGSLGLGSQLAFPNRPGTFTFSITSPIYIWDQCLIADPSSPDTVSLTTLRMPDATCPEGEVPGLPLGYAGYPDPLCVSELAHKEFLSGSIPPLARLSGMNPDPVRVVVDHRVTTSSATSITLELACNYPEPASTVAAASRPDYATWKEGLQKLRLDVSYRQ